jgi:hypothetical protein
MSPEVPLSRQQPRKPNSAIVHIKKKTIRHPMIDDEAVAGTDDEEDDEEDEEEDDEEEEEEDSGMMPDDGVSFKNSLTWL